MAHRPHKLAIIAITHADDRAKTTGFRKAMREAISNSYSEDDLFNLPWHFSDAPVYIPDAYIVDEEERLVRVYEVEDSHALEPEKLDYYLSLATTIDDETTDWEFELVVTDRYGTLDRLIPLHNLVGAGIEISYPSLKRTLRDALPSTRKCYRCNKTFESSEHTQHLETCLWNDT